MTSTYRRPLPVQLGQVTEQQLADYFAKRPSHKAGSLDGWTTREAKLLPAAILEVYADVLNAIEAGAAWPASFEHQAQPILAKEQGSKGRQPLKQRNLTLESVFYAAWTGIRYADPAVTQWREGWLKQSMRGGRRHANTNDITYKLALLWEESHYSQQRIVSLFLDRAKCFDRISRDIVRNLLLEMGAPPAVLMPACACMMAPSDTSKSATHTPTVTLRPTGSHKGAPSPSTT